MTTTDDRPPVEDIAQETAALDRLRKLREARDDAHKALQDAIAETHQAGMYFEVINTAVSECPAWCDRTCETDPVDGSIGHHSALLQAVAGGVRRGGRAPCRMAVRLRRTEARPGAPQADVHHPERRRRPRARRRGCSSCSSSGSPAQDSEPSPASVAATMRLYGANPARDDR